jgi:hypothetical protein
MVQAKSVKTNNSGINNKILKELSGTVSMFNNGDYEAVKSRFVEVISKHQITSLLSQQ